MNVLVVFTYDYSINTWIESGTFNKEIENYKLMSNKGLRFTFHVFGNRTKIRNLG